ncbi:MAG TPA: tetratricopeptide repeat protein, partial [Verrucomicrobiae bacterium]
KDVLCGFFVLLTFWFYARFANESKVQSPKSKVHYWLALVSFALALMSKAMAVTLPFLLLLLDVWPLNRVESCRLKDAGCSIPKLQLSTFNLQLLTEKLPFFALTAVFCVVTFLVQQHSEATPSLSELGLGIRLENIIVSYLRYLGWSLWPANLAMFYAFPYDNHFYLALWPGWEIAAGTLALAGISVLCVKHLFRRPYLAVGWFWYLGTMVPVIGFVQVGSQGMADRYTYIPLIGPVISLVWLVWEQCGSRAYAKTLLALLTTAILAASLAQTRHQLQFWKNTDALTKHTIEVTGENPRAEYIAGLGLEHEGRIAEAMVHYRNAMTSQPMVKEAYYAMGRLLGQQGKWTMAEQAYALMLENNPNDFNAHLGLVNILPHLGRMAEAETHLKATVQNCPDEPEALNNLAWTLATSEHPELRDGAQAVKCAERACQLTDYRETIVVGTLGAAYAEAGRFDDAIATAQKACDLAEKSGEKDLLQKNQELLELYRQHQPCREAASPGQLEPPSTNQPSEILSH